MNNSNLVLSMLVSLSQRLHDMEINEGREFTDEEEDLWVGITALIEDATNRGRN